MTQQNAAMVEEATAASRNLAREADRMAARSDRFALSGDDTYSAAQIGYAA